MKTAWQSRFERVVEILSGLDLKSTGKWFVLASLVGVVGGLGAIAFHFATQLVLHFALAGVAGYAPMEPAGEFLWFPHVHDADLSVVALLAVLVAGGLASGFLVFTFAPEAKGHGTDGAIDAYHQKRGVIRGRIPIVKTIASAITLGTGGSGGREGPIAQIGAGFGSLMARWLGLPVHDRRVLLAAGMGAGVGAIFRAPLAGALFAGEILYRDADIESEVIVPAAISSIVAYTVYSLSLPAELQFVPLFGAGLDFRMASPLELLPLTGLAVVLVLAGVLFVKTFYGMEHLFTKVPLAPHVRPAIGALLAGVTAVGLYYAFGRDLRALAVLSSGYSALQQSFQSAAGMGVLLLFTIALGKIVTTSFTIGSGGSGGVFGPSMVIGGCIGAGCGLLFHEWWPGVVVRPEAYVILGMAGFFSGCARAPISTVIMVFEMTGSYKMLLPTMWVSTLCFLLGRRWTLYSKQVPTRLESPAHRGSFIVDVLEGIRVGDVYDPSRTVRTVQESTSLEEIVHLLAETEQLYFPVVDAQGRMVGVFSSTDVRRYLYDESIWRLAIAADVMVSPFLLVTPEDDLNTALMRFTRKNIDELPVLDPGDPGKLLGMLRRKDAIAYYNQRLLEQKKSGDEEP